MSDFEDRAEKRRRRSERRRLERLQPIIATYPGLAPDQRVRYERFDPREHDFFVGVLAEAMWRNAAGGDFKADVHYLDAMQEQLRRALTAAERFTLRLDDFLPLRVALLAHEPEPSRVPTVARAVEEVLAEALEAVCAPGCGPRSAEGFTALADAAGETVRAVLAKFREPPDPLLVNRYESMLQYVVDADTVRVLLKKATNA